MKNIKILIYLLFFLILNGCGFTVLDQTQIKNYEILEITSQGDKKVNFFLKNELNNLLHSNVATDKLIINIKTEKTKTIKEKNKKNQITKYSIKIESLVELNFVNKDLTKSIMLENEGFYNVNKNHSITLNNQRNIEKNLNDKLSQDLSNKILKIINEF